VTIDDHEKAPYRSWGSADATALGAIVKQAVPHARLAMMQAARFILRGMIFSENRFPLFRIMLALDFAGHDLFGKPVSTFPDHALGCRRN
jgi:hypothetical protein